MIEVLPTLLNITVGFFTLVFVAKIFIGGLDFRTAAVCGITHGIVNFVVGLILTLLFGPLVVTGFPLLIATIISLGAWLMIIMWQYELDLNLAIVLSLLSGIVKLGVMGLLGQLF